jgi:hypothetical protein
MYASSLAGQFLSGLLLLLLFGGAIAWWNARGEGPLLEGRASRGFDWATALVFFLSVVIARELFGYWFHSLSKAGPSVWQVYYRGLVTVIAGALQGLWLHRKVSRLGKAWMALSVMEGLVQVWTALAFERYGPSYLSMQQQEMFFRCYWAVIVVMRVVILSRHYRHAWLLVVAGVYGQAGWTLLARMVEPFRRLSTPLDFIKFYALAWLTPLLQALAMGAALASPRWREWRASLDRLSGKAREGLRETLQSLARCRPLEDPILSLRSIFGWMGGLLFAPWGYFAGYLLLARAGNDEALGVALAVGVAALPYLITAPIVFLLTPRLVTSPNAFIVRAFRRDEQTGHLRDRVSAALGPRGRLFGIRDPRRRFGFVTRCFALMEGAFRYLGSNHCDLEAADRNWLARVLATLAFRQINFVLIDLREITEAVTVEVRVVVLAMTPRRVIWLMDDTRPREEWVRRIHEMTEGGVDADAPLHLLNVDEAVTPESRSVIETVDRVLAESAGPQHAEEWRQALEQAHTLARSHVASRDWRTWWFETLPGVFWIAAAILGGASAFLEASGLKGVGVLVVAIPGLVLIVRTLISGARAIGRRQRLRALGKLLAPARGW